MPTSFSCCCRSLPTSWASPSTTPTTTSTCGTTPWPSWTPCRRLSPCALRAAARRGKTLLRQRGRRRHQPLLRPPCKGRPHGPMPSAAACAATVRCGIAWCASLSCTTSAPPPRCPPCAASCGAPSCRCCASFSCSSAPTAAGQAPATRPAKFARIAQVEALVSRVLDEGLCFIHAAACCHGDDLAAIGVARGPQMGLFLERLLDEVVDERLENNRQALLSQAVRWLASPGENSQKSHK